MKKLFGITSCFLVVVMMLALDASAELYPRAPDVLPGTTAEMRNPAFWIARMEKPDEVIMTPQEVRRMNDEYVERVSSPDPFGNEPEDRVPNLSYYWPGLALFIPDLESLTPEALRDTVKTRIQHCIDHLRKQKYGSILAVEYRDSDIDEFESEMALGSVEEITLRDGIAVRNANLKNVPTLTPDKMGMRENAKTRWDLFCIGILKIGKPVKVLHSSKSGEYVFVQCEIGYGWVKSIDIAFGSKREIDSFVNARDFVVCTGDRAAFYSDNSCTYASGSFRMGDRLPLATKDNPRLVKVPVRLMSGKFITETTWLAENADVHVGWLPYTRRNVIVTALKLLDNTYDWTGAWFGRQHETTYRDIFCCFGFELPYHGGLFTFFNRNDESVLHPEVGQEEQFRVILEHEPFITIQSCGGHAQLFIGEYNGAPIVFDQHGYGYDDENGKYVEVRRCCLGVPTMPGYFLRRKVTFLVLK